MAETSFVHVTQNLKSASDIHYPERLSDNDYTNYMYNSDNSGNPSRAFYGGMIFSGLPNASTIRITKVKVGTEIQNYFYYASEAARVNSLFYVNFAIDENKTPWASLDRPTLLMSDSPMGGTRIGGVDITGESKMWVYKEFTDTTLINQLNQYKSYILDQTQNPCRFAIKLAARGVRFFQLGMILYYEPISSIYAGGATLSRLFTWAARVLRRFIWARRKSYNDALAVQVTR